MIAIFEPEYLAHSLGCGNSSCSRRDVGRIKRGRRDSGCVAEATVEDPLSDCLMPNACTVQVTEVIYRAESPTHLMYTLILENTEAERVTPPSAKPTSTP